MSNISDVVKNDVVKKTVNDKLAAKVNSIDNSEFVLKTKYQTDKGKSGKTNSWYKWTCKKNKTYWIRK